MSDRLLTNAPTVTPAAIDGIEPVLMYPKVPPWIKGELAFAYLRVFLE